MVSLILVRWTGSTVSQEGRGEGRANDNLLWINKLLVDYLPGKISVDEMIILFIQQSRLDVFQAKSLVYSWKRWLSEVSWIWVQSYVANLHMALFSTSPATQLQKKTNKKQKKRFIWLVIECNNIHFLETRHKYGYPGACNGKIYTSFSCVTETDLTLSSIRLVCRLKSTWKAF